MAWKREKVPVRFRWGSQGLVRYGSPRLGTQEVAPFPVAVVSVLVAVLGLPPKDAGARSSSSGVARPSFAYPPDGVKWLPPRVPGSRAGEGRGWRDRTDRRVARSARECSLALRSPRHPPRVGPPSHPRALSSTSASRGTGHDDAISIPRRLPNLILNAQPPQRGPIEVSGRRGLPRGGRSRASG